MTKFQTVGPNGAIVTGSTDLDPSSAVVIWAWSNSCNDWLRQSGAVEQSVAVAGIQALMAECPEIRPCLTQCESV
jgi:hypothetical protein